MSAAEEYRHTPWSENCALCVQLKQRADAVIAELKSELDKATEKLELTTIALDAAMDTINCYMVLWRKL